MPDTPRGSAAQTPRPEPQAQQVGARPSPGPASHVEVGPGGATAEWVTRHLIDQHGARVTGPRSPTGEPEALLHNMAHERGDADHAH